MYKTVLFFMILFINLNLYSQQKLVISIFGEDTDPVNLVSKEVLRQAYQSLDISIEFKNLPGSRSLIHADLGLIDGDLVRHGEINKEYPNLIPVPIAIYTVEFVVFVKDTNIKITNWESLWPYTISYLAGIKIIEENTAGMKVEAVQSEKQAFLKLYHSRSDIVIDPLLMGLVTLKQLNLTGITITGPPLETIKLYHHLHNKHELLVPKITRILEDMQKTKQIDQITNDIISEILE
ncbi:MAG: ABC transporter substrate-binding protein [Spirochaetes bacterium]|nr:ABC transporter substrate-binding protein [Spirochaetota bacterium]